MSSRKMRLRKTAAGIRMYSRDRLMRLRNGRLRQMGVKRLRWLGALPVLMVLILLAGWLRLPKTVSMSYHPEDSRYLLPLTGWAVRADTFGEDSRLDVSLIYAEATWAELEPEKGTFDFEGFEERNHLNEWWAEGKRLVFRLVCDRPGEAGHMDVPGWLYEAMGGEGLAGSFYEGAQGGGFSPDYSSLIMREAHRKLIAAIAGRYDGHPGVAYIEMGSLGERGEWTVSGESGGAPLPVSTISREYAWHYTSSFANTLMLMRRPYRETGLLAVGLYNPRLGDAEDTWEYLDQIADGGYDEQIETDLIAMPDFFEGSASGAHIPQDVDLNGMIGEGGAELIRQLVECRPSYVVLDSPTAALTDDTVEALAEISGLIGCRLWIRSAEWDTAVRPGVRSRVLLSVRNDGDVPLHAAWPVALGLFDGERPVYVQQTGLDSAMLVGGAVDLMAWIDVPDQLPPGAYDLKLAILDPATGEAGVRLSMSECDPDTLWTALGEMTVR